MWRRVAAREYWTWRWTQAWPASSVVVVVFLHGRRRRAPRAGVETDKVSVWALGDMAVTFGRRVGLVGRASR
jgi:hypothetical protein